MITRTGVPVPRSASPGELLCRNRLRPRSSASRNLRRAASGRAEGPVLRSRCRCDGEGLRGLGKKAVRQVLTQECVAGLTVIRACRFLGISRQAWYQAQRTQRERAGRDQLFQVLRAHRLLVPRRRAYHKTTHSHHRFRRHPNLLEPGAGQMIAIRPIRSGWPTSLTCRPARA